MKQAAMLWDALWRGPRGKELWRSQLWELQEERRPTAQEEVSLDEKHVSELGSRSIQLRLEMRLRAYES